MANTTTDIPNKTNDAASELKNKNMNGEYPLEKKEHNAKEKLGGMASDPSVTPSESVKSIRKYVAENPMKSLTYAVASGFATGILLTIVFRSQKS